MSDEHVRVQLVNLLMIGQAHMTFEEAVRDFPLDDINTRVDNVEYTFWHLLEHVRICQWDILDYMRNPYYKELTFPDDLWPAHEAVTDEAGWQKTIQQFLSDRAELIAIINDPETDFYSPISYGYDGHTIFREILVVADHNAYHIGEFCILRHIRGHW